MQSLTITDSGVQYNVVLHNVDVPDMELPERPAHQEFMDWWRGYCRQVHISYPWTVAEPQGVRIVRKLLEWYGMEQLKRMAVHLFLSYGEKLRDNPNHFAIFSSMAQQLHDELEEQ